LLLGPEWTCANGVVEARMAVISHIGFASSRSLRGRMLERLRRTWVSHAVFILEDEVLGALVLHADGRGQRVTTLKEFEREHILVGAVQPKIALGPVLAAVLLESRGSGRRFGHCGGLVCEVIRRAGYPGSFGLGEDIDAAELFAFLQRPPAISRDSVRLFNSSSGGKTPSREP
jgi:hypothetical protein